MVPHKLSAIWFSPYLPVLFFISAVMAGLAMLIVESTLSSKFFGRGLELDLLQGIGKGLSWIILLYLAIRGVDLVTHGVGAELLTMTTAISCILAGDRDRIVITARCLTDAGSRRLWTRLVLGWSDGSGRYDDSPHERRGDRDFRWDLADVLPALDGSGDLGWSCLVRHSGVRDDLSVLPDF